MKKNTLFLLTLLFLGSFATAMERYTTISVQELYQRIERIKPILHNTETGNFSFGAIMQSVKDEMRQFRYIDPEVASSLIQEIFHTNGYRELDDTIHDLIMPPVVNAHANDKNDKYNNNLPLNNVSQDEAEECSICFDAFEQAVTTPCNHTFCAKCINDWLNNNQNCPICRKECRTQDLTALKK